MKTTKILFSFITLVIIMASCSKNDNAPIDTPDGSTENTAVLSGEISTVETRVYISGYNAATNLYQFDWAKTTTRPMALFFKQDKTAGTNILNYSGTVTLNVKADGTCSFSGVTTPGWFVFGRDSVAGAIAGATAPGYGANGEWTFSQPNSITKGGDYYLPMYFPPTKTTLISTTQGKVSAKFQTLGSMLAIEVANNASVPYPVDNYYLKSRSFRMSGTTTFVDGKRQGANIPGFLLSEGADTARSITISGLTVPANKKDTFYVWVNQNAAIKDRILSNISTGVENANRNVFYRSQAERATAALLEPGKFYTLRFPINGIPGELMITELTDGLYAAKGITLSGYQNGTGFFMEVYNGTTVAIQLNNYFLYEDFQNYWQQLPTYSLGAGKMVILALPPLDNNNWNWNNNLTKIANNVPVIQINQSASNYYFSPFWEFRAFTLTKYTPDFSTIIDRANTSGPGWYGNYNGMRRKHGILRPAATYNSSEWTPYLYDYPNYAGETWGELD